MYANNRLRTNGDTSWYSQTYGGGWRMTDPTGIRPYGGKQVDVDRAIATPSVQVGGNPLGRPAPTARVEVLLATDLGQKT